LSEIDGQDQSGMRVEYFVGQDIGWVCLLRVQQEYFN
jgi:hypothetical protein